MTHTRAILLGLAAETQRLGVRNKRQTSKHVLLLLQLLLLRRLLLLRLLLLLMGWLHRRPPAVA